VPKPGSGMNGARCEAAWATVSPNGAAISKEELATYMADADFTVLDPDNDGTIDANEFKAGCKGGLIKIAH
jgi:dihydroorotase-like cyclic amidohydrolase